MEAPLTWSFADNDLAQSPKDQVRIVMGDTIAADPQLTDEEISFFLTQRTSIYGAAALCCRSLATQYSRSVTMQEGNSKRNYSDLSKAYTLRAIQYDILAISSGDSGLPYTGGISIADKARNEQDEDKVPENFSVGMFDSELPVGQLPVNAPTSDKTDR